MKNYNTNDVNRILSTSGDADIDALLAEIKDINVDDFKPTSSKKDIISTDEINEFLFELEADTSILRKKPSDISEQSELFQLKVLEEIYVLPLQELANRINMKLNNSKVEFYGLNGLSITGKSMKIRDYLLSKGCTKQMFMKVVPKTEAEINILLTARANGFDLGFNEQQTLDNDDRVMRAKQYLNSLNNQENYGRSK